MAENLRIITQPEELEPKFEAMRTLDLQDMTVHDAAVVCNLGRGVLGFTRAAFPAASSTRLFAKHHNREPEGRGAHFDVYDGVSDSYHPWIAIYNLAGRATLTAALLPEDLAESYRLRFPEPDENAYIARRDFSRIALTSKDITVATAEIHEGSGFMLLQRKKGPLVIHNITPRDPGHPGEFVKFVCPAPSEEAIEKAVEDGMQPIDDFITNRIRSVRAEDMSKNPLGLDSEGLSYSPMPGLIPLPRQTRRTCNLD